MTAEEINALPPRVREYIHQLETRCDPAGDIQRIAFLKETVEALHAKIIELEAGLAERSGISLPS